MKYSPNLQNQSHHKQAGRENGISVAVKRGRKRRGKRGEERKESGALYEKLCEAFSSLAVRPQNIKVEEKNLHSLNCSLSFSLSLSWAHMHSHMLALPRLNSSSDGLFFHPRHKRLYLSLWANSEIIFSNFHRPAMIENWIKDKGRR